jgi:organic hydroperoxide reductase OsmC/OhrA
VSARARVFEYAVSLDESWSVSSDRGGAALALAEEEWTPEHLLLAALARCSLTSLRYHTRRADLEARATATARGVVTRREVDGRFAFVELEVEAHVMLQPEPDADAVRDLVAKGERDCFVGASLSVEPRYRWIVNGAQVG